MISLNERFIHIFNPNRLEKLWIFLVKHIIKTIYLGNKKRTAHVCGSHLDITSSKAIYVSLGL